MSDKAVMRDNQLNYWESTKNLFSNKLNIPLGPSLGWSNSGCHVIRTTIDSIIVKILIEFHMKLLLLIGIIVQITL